MTPEQQAAIRVAVRVAIELALDPYLETDWLNNITDAAIAAHLKALEAAGYMVVRKSDWLIEHDA